MPIDLLARVRGLLASHPWIARTAPWAVSIVSLALGFVTLFVFRRGLPHVSWIVGYLLVVALLLIVLAEVPAESEARARRLFVGAAEYLLQSLCHGIFLFVLPAYYAAATMASPNAILVILLAAAALLTAIDHWYRALIHPRRWLRCTLTGMAMFAGFNVALALLGLRPIVAAVGGAGLAALAVTPLLRSPGPGGWTRAVMKSAALAAVAMAVVRVEPAWVPPAPMFMARAVVARDVVDLEPVDVVADRIDAQTVQRWGTLAAYTAIYAPAGVKQSLEHVWSRDGEQLARIRLSTPVVGGRREGFRTFSRRRLWQAPIAGQYRVDVVTTSGQLIGRVSFAVAP